MTEPVRFTLDGREIEAAPDETIWQAATRLGTEIPHLCHRAEPANVLKIKDRLPRRFPGLKGVGITEAWSGTIDVTPDAVPTLGEDDRLKGLYIATGPF